MDCLGHIFLPCRYKVYLFAVQIQDLSHYRADTKRISLPCKTEYCLHPLWRTVQSMSTLSLVIFASASCLSRCSHIDDKPYSGLLHRHSSSQEADQHEWTSKKGQAGSRAGKHGSVPLTNDNHLSVHTINCRTAPADDAKVQHHVGHQLAVRVLSMDAGMCLFLMSSLVRANAQTCTSDSIYARALEFLGRRQRWVHHLKVVHAVNMGVRE